MKLSGAAAVLTAVQDPAGQLVGDGQLAEVPDEGVAGRDAGVLDAQAVGAAAAQTQLVAPVVEPFELVAGDDEHQRRGRLPLPLRNQGVADEVGGVRRARAVVPGAVQHPAALAVRLGRPTGSDGRRADELAAGEQLVLRPLVEHRARHQRVGGPEQIHPARRGAAAGQRRRDPDEGLGAEPVTPVAPGDEDAVEAGLREGLVGVLGVVAALLGLRLPPDERRGQGLGAGDQFVRGEAGFRR
ncbi:hypothetical protein ACVWXU_000775 [Streptomyces sp. TE33382]